LPYKTLFSLVESRLFTRRVVEYLTDHEYAALQQTLITDPAAGVVVPGSGGVRKLRWAATGRGKRGGYRVVYFVRHASGVIWMLTIYPKNVTENIPAHVLRLIAKEVEDAEAEARRRPRNPRGTA
jgi:mRNA-degrading endonuclease RelE of RelBE toxin-antitoxin system